MHYLDKQHAKVNIMYKLVDAGWQVFGYKQDESDAMVDYYSPARWSGVATKNGFVLLIDVYNLSLSGLEIDNQTYPLFRHTTPKRASWHIEKDGEIVAKGNGVYATNTYDWENDEVSPAKQKAEKVKKFIDRIEKTLIKLNSDSSKNTVTSLNNETGVVTTEESKSATVTLNEEKNGIEISFDQKPDAEVIEELKSNGFRWSRFNGGKWWAKQSPETIAYAESLKIDKGETQEDKSEDAQMNENNNVNINTEIDVFTQEEKIMSNEKTVNDIETFEDIFSKFDEIEITNDQRISDDDYKFCQEQETNYKSLIVTYEGFYNELNKISHGAFHGVMSSYDYRDSLTRIKESFIRNICYYFINKYKVTIDHEKIINKLTFESGFQDVLDNIFVQLDGYSFTEKAEKEIKDNSKEMFKYGDKISIKGNKLVLDGYFAHLDSIWKEYSLSESKVNKIFQSLQLFDSGLITENEELKNKYCGYDNSKKLENYERYTTQTMKKVKSIKFFKNGKLEIEFIGNQEAVAFASEYCGYKKHSA
ncbi:hypothetical protein [Paenibacillus silvae]|uniref:Uncharacterized protein n=1 Tax=Paenibacillus silvae TaxID=1325358 RepID=A0A2W6NNP1_9BACL|nr:hypothetical protein [Paenibacillus silvae]PZT57472.1 hypothetical protein DN757_02110 [Paenibacillus silvae]